MTQHCAGCARPIVGAYIEAMGKAWHAEHFACARCATRFTQQGFFEGNRKPYCRACYEVLFVPHCRICDRPMSWYVENFWGDVYCSEHQDTLPVCFSCGRPICASLTGGGMNLGDGRTMCNLCLGTAVTQGGDARNVLARVRHDLARMGMELGGAAVSIRLVDQHEMQHLAHALGRGALHSGMTATRRWTQQGHETGREIAEIAVLHSLPGTHFASIVAHELCHAWIFLNKFPALPSLIEEGLCQLVAYRWLDEQRVSEARYHQQLIAESKDPIYGEGFRLAKRGLLRVPLPLLLRFVQTHGSFP